MVAFYLKAVFDQLRRVVESHGNQGRKAALLAPGVLFLMSGAGGLPFAKGLDDSVDGVMRRI
ncbi:MAG: hypothetical protein H7274_00810 [Rhodoferax sp.]|nr:hypothetical protein [Rhodoferax sp.]